MFIGVNDVFKIGLGPSSSHTTGPMKAARAFAAGLDDSAVRVRATVFGSLAWTGHGHATDRALLLGLAGFRPETVAPGQAPVSARFEVELVFDRERRYERHTNAMRFEAFDAVGAVVRDEVWYSIGGGFVVRDGEEAGASDGAPIPFPCHSATRLLACPEPFAEMSMANELTRRPLAEIEEAVDAIASAMFDCIDRGLHATGELPGALRVKRRAKGLFDQLDRTAPTFSMEAVSAFAIAVNEENAAGGRVVTAPTNGAAGVIPAVLRYYRDFYPRADRKGVRDFLLVASLFGAIIKTNASISGAEVGCQGEVGSAAAMAAAGLTAALGGSNGQVENAAEIALEHHLGMTCDPVGGLVQIPCIERNAFGAVKAINASILALRGDGTHRVSLDQAIATMRQTGHDMAAKYKETSLGGLAVNVPDC
jgi:L-serine dehydratase